MYIEGGAGFSFSKLFIALSSIFVKTIDNESYCAQQTKSDGR